MRDQKVITLFITVYCRHTCNINVYIPAQNECSFVSLRDVERAMIVFEYFYEKMDRVFAPLINKKAEEAYNEYVDSDDEVWIQVESLE